MLRDDWPKSLRRDHRPVRRPRVNRRRPVRRRPVLRWRGDVQSGPVPTDEHITVRRRPNLRRRKRPMRRPRLVVIWRLRLHHRRPGKCRYVVVAGLVCRAVSGLPASSFQRRVIRGFSSFHGQLARRRVGCAGGQERVSSALMQAEHFRDFDEFMASVRGVDCTMMLQNAARHSWRILAAELAGVRVQ